jgi:hypothetical protein
VGNACSSASCCRWRLTMPAAIKKQTGIRPRAQTSNGSRSRSETGSRR